MERRTADNAVDWSLVEADYLSGGETLRAIGARHGVSHVAVAKQAKKNGWERLKTEKGKRISQPAPFITAKNSAQRSPSGFVYVIYIETPDQRFYKIGMSAAFSDRLSAHQCASPFPMRVAVSYFVPDMRAEEGFLHSYFDDQRIRGEWFSLAHADLEMIAMRSLLS